MHKEEALAQLEQLQQLSEDKRNEMALLKEELRQKELQIQQWQTELKLMDRHASVAAFTQAQARYQEMQKAGQLMTFYRQAAEACETAEKNLSEKESELQKLAVEHQTLSQQYAEAEEDARKSRLLFEKMQLSVSDYAKHLRMGLQIGDHCPVCGQQVGELPRDAAYEAALKPVREQAEKASQLAQSCRDRLKGLEAQCAVEKRAQDRLRKEKAGKEEILRRYGKEASDKCLTFGVTLSQKDAETQLSCLMEAQQQLMREKQAQWQAADQLQEKLNSLLAEKECLSQQQNNMLAVWSDIEKRIAERQVSMKSFQEAADKQSQLADTLMQTLSAKISYSGWQQDVEACRQRLISEAAAWQERQRELQQLRQTWQIGCNEQENARQLCRQVMTLYPEWPLSEKVEASVDTALSWNVLLTQVVALVEKKSGMDRREEECRRQIDAFQQSDAALPLDRLAVLATIPSQEMFFLENELNSVESRLQAAKGGLKQAEATWQKQMQSRTETGEGETLETLKVRCEQLRQAIAEKQAQKGGLAQRLSANEKQLCLYAEKMHETEIHQQKFMQWDAMCRIFGDREGKTFRVIAQSFVMRELLVHANAYLHQFSERYELLCQSNLTILVKDLYYGGLVRPVDMVSGGESFVVSLALALGLSSLHRNHLSADILFIDEGFGSLSSDLLEVVVSTLSRLREAGGRRVGIISHIDALRERIPVKILVEKTNHTSSRISIINQ